jgi:hypothetical protein
VSDVVPGKGDASRVVSVKRCMLNDVTRVADCLKQAAAAASGACTTQLSTRASIRGSSPPDSLLSNAPILYILCTVCAHTGNEYVAHPQRYQLPHILDALDRGPECFDFEFYAEVGRRGWDGCREGMPVLNVVQLAKTIVCVLKGSRMSCTFTPIAK